MSLKIRLKPHEKMLVGHAVLRNGDKASEFYIENKVSILREKDIMRGEDVTTPGQRLYFLIQLMYIDGENIASYHDTYRELAQEVVATAPSTRPYLEEMSTLVRDQDYYHALKSALKLMNYEQCLVSQAAPPPPATD
ncbi:MAG TPA: flagellar biosynthesis repressor FlbT [Geobacteraceae bacterium]